MKSARERVTDRIKGEYGTKEGSLDETWNLPFIDRQHFPRTCRDGLVSTRYKGSNFGSLLSLNSFEIAERTPLELANKEVANPGFTTRKSKFGFLATTSEPKD